MDLAAAIVRSRKITPAQELELREVLALQHHELERYTSIAGDQRGALFLVCHASGASRVSSVVTLLCARGLLRVRDGQDSDGVRDWISALRIANTLTLIPSADPLDLSPCILGNVLENTAVRLLSEHLRSRGLQPFESAEIVRTLSTRGDISRAVARHLLAEHEQLCAMLLTWAETNQLPAAYRGLRFYLPVVASSRRAVAARMTALLRADLFRSVRRSRAGAIPAKAPVRIAHIGGWAFHLTEGAGWSERLATLWSNDRAAELGARLIRYWKASRTEALASSFQHHEREVRALLKHCVAEVRSL